MGRVYQWTASSAYMVCVAIAIGMRDEPPKIHLVFQNWLSLLLILGLLLGFIGWITWIAYSVRHIKRSLHDAITRAEFAKAFDDFRKEIQGTR